MEPRDLQLGHDIRIQEVRECILEDIMKFKPKLVACATMRFVEPLDQD